MCASRRRQAGQALIEALVGLQALIVLMLLVTWLGKVQSLRQSVIDASRLLAFECTVRPAVCASPEGNARLADEARRRVFSRLDAPVRSDEVLADAAPRDEHNPLWSDAAGLPLIERFAEVGVRLQPQSFDAGLSVATARESALVNNALDFLSRVAGPGRFGLAITEGLWVARTQAGVSAPASPLLGLPALALQARAAILTDAWTASGPDGAEPDSVASRVGLGSRLPGSLQATIDAGYLPTRGFIGLMEGIGLEPEAGSFRYHESDVDVVPADRLGRAP